MGVVISTINLKGGVGKTTLTAVLAEFLSGVHHKKVLLIDLDPQTNLTTMMIGEDRWEALNEEGRTLASLFRDALARDGDPPTFDLAKTLVKNVSPVADVRSVDLLPSSLDLIGLRDRLGSMSSGRFFSSNPTIILKRAVRGLLPKYDYVLIDCPPDLGIVTLNGLRISDGYIIPTIPDILSTYGIDQIQTHVADFADEISERITEIGIVVSKYRAASTVHMNTVARLQANPKLPVVLEPFIPEANQIAESAEYVKRSTLRQKYGYAGHYNTLAALTDEFVQTVEETV